MSYRGDPRGESVRVRSAFPAHEEAAARRDRRGRSPSRNAASTTAPARATLIADPAAQKAGAEGGACRNRASSDGAGTQRLPAGLRRPDHDGDAGSPEADQKAGAEANRGPAGETPAPQWSSAVRNAHRDLPPDILPRCRNDSLLATVLLTASAFASGIAALVLELQWGRQLALTFGGSHNAVAAVLTAFMLGLGVGSLARRPDRRSTSPRPRWPSASIELALASDRPPARARPEPAAESRRRLAARGRLRRRPGLRRFALSRWPSVCSIVPTTLMGATYPILVRATADGSRSSPPRHRPALRRQHPGRRRRCPPGRIRRPPRVGHPRIDPSPRPAPIWRPQRPRWPPNFAPGPGDRSKTGERRGVRDGAAPLPWILLARRGLFRRRRSRRGDPLAPGPQDGTRQLDDDPDPAPRPDPHRARARGSGGCPVAAAHQGLGDLGQAADRRRGAAHRSGRLDARDRHHRATHPARDRVGSGPGAAPDRGWDAGAARDSALRRRLAAAAQGRHSTGR